MSKECIVCKNKKMVLFHKGVRDNSDIDVLKCEKCGLLQLSQMEHINEEFYENELMHLEQYNAIKDAVGEQTWESWLEETEKDDNRRYISLKDICKEKAVLDFGCGNGGFLRRVVEEADNCVGVELDRNARENIIREGIKVYASIEETSQKWDVITMFQVMEHLEDPRRWLMKLYDYLKEGGILVIETPNSDDALLSLYKNKAFEDFTFWSVHVLLYNSYNLEKLVTEVGYDSVDNGQVQRYPLSNHLHWLSLNKPGGHEKWTEFNESELNQKYEDVLKKYKMCDTLFAVFKKK